MPRLSTAKSVVRVLGGAYAVARMTGANVKSVWFWISEDVFPARLHDLMTRALKRKGISAPARLWAQETEKKKRAA